jgi:hypothetical protein
VSDRIQAGLKKSRKPPTIDDAKKWHGVDLNWAYTVLLRGIQRLSLFGVKAPLIFAVMAPL